MDLYSILNVVLTGFFGFAAVHYFLQWWFSRSERVLLAFSLFCLFAAWFSVWQFLLAQATTLGAAQFALTGRASLGLISHAAALIFFLLLAGHRIRTAMPALAILVTAAVLNLFVPVDIIRNVGTGSFLIQAQTPWWVAFLYVTIATVYVYGLFIARIVWPTDHVGAALIAVGASTSLAAAAVIAGLIDLAHIPVRYVGAFPQTVFVVSMGIFLSREYAGRLARSIASEARFRSYFELPLTGVAINSPGREWLAANNRLCEILGYSWPELRATNWEVLTHPQDRARDVHEFQRLMTGEVDSYSLEQRFIQKDGTIIWCDIAIGCVRKKDGTIDFECATVQDVTDRKRAQQELRESEAHLRALEDEERRRLARILHDSASQDLAALKMLLARLNRTGTLTEADRAVLDESIGLADQSMKEIRTLSYLLYPPFLDENGLLSAIRWYAAGFADRSGINVELDLPLALERLPQEVENTLFRVVQEGLTNVHRHAHSPTALIRLRVNGQLLLEIEDRGLGMSSTLVAQLRTGGGGLGVGIAGMRQRLKQLGGTLQIESSGGLTIVRAALPFQQQGS